MSLLKTLVLLLAVFYFGLGAALYFFQRSFIYFPTPAVSLSGLADVQIQHQSMTLNGHVVNAGKSELILYFGGNAEQIGYSLQELFSEFPGYTVIGFNYRGYGGSEGEPGEAELKSDALFLYDYLAKDYDRVIIIGRSLGSGIAAYLASKRKVDNLVLVTPYDSIAAIAAKQFWYYPVNWMLADHYDSFALAQSITAPTLLVIAEEDTIIPPEHSQRLLTGFKPGVANAITLKGKGHNTVSDGAEYYSELKMFLK